MRKKAFSRTLFFRAPIIGIVRNLSIEELTHLLPLYREAGLTTLEITMNTPNAGDMIRYALEQYGEDLNIGAGTVCTKKDLKAALDAGAQFIVTPILDKKIVRTCVKEEIPVFPGAFTPTEIYKAWSMGATMVKVFPATSLGPAYIKDLLAPLDDLQLVPTGGVRLDNMADFLSAGARGVGIGSQLFDRRLIEQQDWNALKVHFQEFITKLPGRPETS